MSYGNVNADALGLLVAAMKRLDDRTADHEKAADEGAKTV
jgi:hypothetical protein